MDTDRNEAAEDDEELPPRPELSRREIEAIARAALAELPEELRRPLEQVAIVLEPYAPDELLEELEIPEDEDLFGLYEGPALTERHAGESAVMPSRVRLFYEAILDACDTEEEAREEIRTTVLHEIGHHFGLDEDQLEARGLA